MSVTQASAAVGEPAHTLDHWVAAGVVPEFEGEWTPAAIGKARLVKRILERGYTLEQVREATEQGRLLSGRLTEIFGLGERRHERIEVARETGLDLSVVSRVAGLLGLVDDEPLREPDRLLLNYVARALEIGLPLEAMLQLTRVYVQSISQLADAEVRLVHLYVHEPLMRSGTSPEEMNREMLTIAEELAPLANQVLVHMHTRMLSHFIAQDVVGHMEAQPALDASDVGRVLVAVAFADLSGYTQLTEREGDLRALDVVEHFLHVISTTLPQGARVIKTIGDEAMVIGPDPEALTLWAVELGARLREQPRPQLQVPRPRIAVHYGHARYRDGDYYGREVNLAARVAGESGAGQVLVTRAVVEAAGGGRLRFEPIGMVRLRGFSESTEIFLASGEGGG